MKKAIVIIFLFLVVSCVSEGDGVDRISFFYKDSLDISRIYKSSDSLWTDKDNYIINDNLLYHSDYNSISIEDLHPKIYNCRGKLVCQVDVRCWREASEICRLEEVSNSGSIHLFFMKCLKYYYRHFRDADSYNRRFHEPVLLTKNSVSYFVKRGKLYSKELDCSPKQLSDIIIEDPMYNEMIVNKNFGIIRTGHRILFSSDSLYNWTQIYEGPRNIKESMCWNDKDSSLMFSQYTPGRERTRHYILRYSYPNDKIDTLQTFYTEQEYLTQGLEPCARHIHILTVDPYTGWIFLGTGDTDVESGIYISKDNGNTFQCLGRGNQSWRTLSFIFTPNYVLWNTDSDAPQYLSQISRSELGALPVDETDVIRFPLYNSALWCTLQSNDLTIMSSNMEGAHYDNNKRIYGIKVDINGIPIVYELWKEPAQYWSDQLFPIGIDTDGIIQFYDTHDNIYRNFKLR